MIIDTSDVCLPRQYEAEDYHSAAAIRTVVTSKVKVKLSLYKSTNRPPLLPGKIAGIHFC